MQTESPNRAARRQSSPAPRRRFARFTIPSAAKRERKAARIVRGARTVDSGLTNLDPAFLISSSLSLLMFAVGLDSFDPYERARRRARGKQQRAARRAGRKG